MNRNYIIFFWILCLILFTFYCVFRLKYLSDNTHKTKHTNTQIHTNTNTKIHTNTNTKIHTNNLQEKYDDTPIITYKPGITAYTGDVLVTIPAITTVPVVTQTNDFIQYIQNIQDKDKISDMLNCDTLYDDNLKVREIGYKNCGEAYADYLDKNYDLNKKYGNNYTLAEICPIASKTPEYQSCLQLLLTKFSAGVHLVDDVNTDMTNSINSRLNTRTVELHKIQDSINPFLYSKIQTDFNNDMLKKGQVATRTDDKLNLINKYYQDRYQGSIETFTNNNNNNNSNSNSNSNNNNNNTTIEQFTNVTLTDIEKGFFGKYKPVTGQFANLADLEFTVEYDDSGNNIYPNINTNTLQGSTPQASAPQASTPQVSTQQGSTPQVSTQQGSTPQASTPQPTTLSKLSPLSVKTNARPVIFTLRNNDIYITYSVSNIDYYKLNKNAVKLILTNKNIIYQSSPNNIVEPLLKHLGLYAPSSINLVFDPYTSTENIKHDTHRLVNDNLDTILVLEKEPTPQTTNLSTPTTSL
jgi:hypothetical protein